MSNSGSMKTVPWSYFSKFFGAPSRMILTSDCRAKPRMAIVCPSIRTPPPIETPGVFCSNSGRLEACALSMSSASRTATFGARSPRLASPRTTIGASFVPSAPSSAEASVAPISFTVESPTKR
ncbi:hypothetical protein D3C87_1505340 [compost metagenome]